MIDFDEVLQFVNKCVDKSGDVIRKHFRNLDNIDVKDDLSPVTVADMQAEKVIRQLILEQYPKHGIVGEELGVTDTKSGYQWIIDPIDGTLSFVVGRPIFGTLLALVHDGVPIVSVIDQPVTGERWVAVQGRGTLLNYERVQTRKCEGLSEAMIATTSPDYFSSEGLSSFSKLLKKSKNVVYGGDCYLYALVASGHLDLVVDSGLKSHDFLPIIPIVEEAGGVITDWQGNELSSDSTGDIIVAGDERVWREALEIF